MAAKTNIPKTIEGNEAVINGVYAWIPKRVLWDMLYSLTPGDDVDEIVRNIIGLANDQGVWFAKDTLKAFSLEKKEEPAETEPVNPPAEKRKSTRKAASKKGPKAKKASSKKTSGDQEELGLPERTRVD